MTEKMKKRKLIHFPPHSVLLLCKMKDAKALQWLVNLPEYKELVRHLFDLCLREKGQLIVKEMA